MIRTMDSIATMRILCNGSTVPNKAWRRTIGYGSKTFPSTKHINVFDRWENENIAMCAGWRSCCFVLYWQLQKYIQQHLRIVTMTRPPNPFMWNIQNQMHLYCQQGRWIGLDGFPSSYSIDKTKRIHMTPYWWPILHSSQTQRRDLCDEEVYSSTLLRSSRGILYCVFSVTLRWCYTILWSFFENHVIRTMRYNCSIHKDRERCSLWISRVWLVTLSCCEPCYSLRQSSLRVSLVTLFRIDIHHCWSCRDKSNMRTVVKTTVTTSLLIVPRQIDHVDRRTTVKNLGSNENSKKGLGEWPDQMRGIIAAPWVLTSTYYWGSVHIATCKEGKWSSSEAIIQTL